MRINNSSWVVLFIFISGVSCQPKTENTNPVIESLEDQLQFDSLQAKEYGADEFGMKRYIFAFLKKGPNRDLDEKEANELQQAHLQNIQRMAKEGKLVLAGPFLDDGEIRGIYIFNVGSIEEARALTNSDPAVEAGSLTMELKEWYGSAALIDVNKNHPRYTRKDF